MAHSVSTLFEPVSIRRPEPSREIELGQFFTPAKIAQFMAGLFSVPVSPVRLLDAGAGEGALTMAFIDRWRDAVGIWADVYVSDPKVS